MSSLPEDFELDDIKIEFKEFPFSYNMFINVFVVASWKDFTWNESLAITVDERDDMIETVKKALVVSATIRLVEQVRVDTEYES